MYEMEDEFIGLLVNNEEWLKGRVLGYARKYEYTKYLLTFHNSDRTLISDISQAIILAVKAYGVTPPELHAEDKYCFDPVSSLGIKEAHKHKTNGIALTIVLGLMKYYRQSYFDLFYESAINTKKQIACFSFLNRCFDRIELGLITGWNSNLETNPAANNDAYFAESVQIEDYYKIVFENHSVPTIFLDNQNRIVNFNRAASKLFTNLRISAYYYYDENTPGFAIPEVIKGINDLISSVSKELTFDISLETPEGKRFYNLFLRKVDGNNNKFNGIILTFNDLTQYREIVQNLQHAVNKVEESDQMKTAFIANMSHEIRTPLNAILGFTDVLLHTNYNKKERTEFLELIRTSSNDLLNIIEDLIDIAKIEAKQLKIKTKPCKPFELVVDLQAIFHEVFKRFGIQDSVELRYTVKDSDKDLIINTDRERLKQILTNLLNNAAKFTDNGFIEFGFKRTDPTSLLFFVRDTGMGIPKDMKEKIFDRFAQVEQSNRNDYRGAGLGLAICKNIINLMGGHIWVESEPGKGSSFYFSLPLMPVTDTIDKIDIGNTDMFPELKINWSDRTILIAEDDETNFIYLSELLKATKVKLVRASNGLEAIKFVEMEDQLNCILMDIKMPEIDGLQATKYISGIRPEIPIIALTAFALEGDKEKCLNAGCKAYLTKPVKKEQLFQLLEKYLRIEKLEEMKSTLI